MGRVGLLTHSLPGGGITSMGITTGAPCLTSDDSEELARMLNNGLREELGFMGAVRSS